MKEKKNPDETNKVITRRTLLSWMGKGAVLSLTGATLASCLAEIGPPDPDGGTGEGFAFEPGSLDAPIFKNWGERTVDKQDLEQILSSWRLRVDGMVESARDYTLADLVEIERTDKLMDFHCVEGWSIRDVPWNGVHLSKLFEEVKPLSSASYVTFHTIDGIYNESLPIEVALEPNTLLAYGISGNTLPLKHGFPLRIVIPRLQAYKSAKYVARIELTDEPIYGYWVQKGYPYEAEVPEGRLREGKY